MYRTLVSAEELADLIARGAVAVFDCQFDLAAPDAGADAYRAGHVPGARYLHLDRDLSSTPDGTNGRHPLPDPEAFAALMRAHGVRTGEQVVVYDASGGAYAARAWWLLRWIGHEAVAVLDGGLPAWRAAGLALKQGDAPAAAPGHFTALAPDPRATVDAAAVLAAIGDADTRLIDARTAARWRGELNALDPVAGHIPGSRNRWFGENLGEDGRFKPADSLAADFDALLDGVAPEQAVLHCGSGVTACHNALAMAVAGRDGARLYPGSWSEWISDPARPVAREV